MGLYAVTGAASGIGKAVAETLRAEGHSVITVDIRDADVVADLSDADACAAAVQKVLEHAPEGLHGFVPCAGVGPDAPQPRLLPLVNYFAVVSMVDGLRPALEKKRGAVVLISSNSSRMTAYNEDYIQALLNGDRDTAVKMVEEGPVDGQGAYGGGKQALVRWMRRNNSPAAAAGVRINAIAPGYTETGMTESGKNDPKYGQAIRDFVDSIPIGRPGLPEDQANAVSFLLSDKASFVSGSVLFVDGGHDAVFRPDEY